MFDARIRPLIDGPLDWAGRRIASSGISADNITIAGCAIGLAAALAIACGAFGLALTLIAANRLCDGLDGAVARATAKTDRGAFLDITLDFVFYAAVPLAFAWVHPAQNALAAAFLLAAFLINGTVFLAFAVLAEKRALTTAAQGQKSLYYLAGLAEGTETIAFFVLVCLWPHLFVWLSCLFTLLCIISAAARLFLGLRLLSIELRSSINEHGSPKVE